MKGFWGISFFFSRCVRGKDDGPDAVNVSCD
uniref:Uncharacterized protein n=1 Tax=Arundo donax TaxID=35708 RepID=A0A0A8Y047_ARUDO